MPLLRRSPSSPTAPVAFACTVTVVTNTGGEFPDTLSLLIDLDKKTVKAGNHFLNIIWTFDNEIGFSAESSVRTISGKLDRITGKYHQTYEIKGQTGRPFNMIDGLCTRTTPKV